MSDSENTDISVFAKSQFVASIFPIDLFRRLEKYRSKQVPIPTRSATVREIVDGFLSHNDNCDNKKQEESKHAENK